MMRALEIGFRHRRIGAICPISFLFGSVLLLGLTAAIHAQPASADTTRIDSMKTYRSPEVVVDAAGILPRVSRGAQPLAVMTQSDIDAANAADISDVLGFAPGVFVKQYGGLGGLRTLSLRGTSAQQTVVLIDGVRYQSSANGALDLSNLPAAAVERIEVVRGGNAVLYGANALGGVVNLVTRRGAEAPAITAGAAVGSFGERRFTLDAGGGMEEHAWNAGGSFTVAGGDYPFDFNEYGETRRLYRENADFTNLFGRGGWSYRNDDGLRLALTFQGFGSERGTPGGVVQGNREQLRARLDERELFSVATLALPAGPWHLSAAASGRLNTLRYHDPDARIAGPAGIDNRYNGREAGLTLRGRRSIGTVGVVEMAGEWSYTTLAGDNLDRAAGSYVERLQWSGSISTNWFLEEGLLGWETGLDAGLRGDLFSDIEGALSPSVGVNWRLGSTPVRARTHLGLSYRAPTFAEQYYLNYGNRDLRPERGVSLDAGLTWEIGESAVLESSFFLIDTRDQIIAVPRSPVSWSAANVGSVRSRGMELAMAGSLFEGRLNGRFSYTLMRSEDRTEGITEGRLLVYSPQELFNGIAEMQLGWLAAGINWQYVSHRFTLPMNDPQSALPHYAIAGASLGTKWDMAGMNFLARIECSNIFDAEYQVVRNYPMPGRIFRAELSVKFGGGGK